MLFATNLKAQEQPLSFGLKAGASNSWIMGLGEKTFGNNKGENSVFNMFFTGGAHVGYAFHEYMGVGLEVNYVRVGGETTEKLAQKGADKGVYSLYTHGLSVPVAFRVFPMGYDPEEGILSINIGPQMSFAFSKEAKIGNAKNPSKDAQFRSDYVSSFNLGAFAGVGYEFPGIGLSVEGRYAFVDFMNLFKDTNEAKSYKVSREFKRDAALRNQLVTLTLGYDFASLII